MASSPKPIDLSGLPPFAPGLRPAESDKLTKIRMPGSGLTRRILDAPALANVPRAAIVQFVMEGDNRIDAHNLARCLFRALRLVKEMDKPITEPESWKGVFGSMNDQTLFG